MAIDELKEKLEKLRLGKGRKKIPENIWLEIINISKERGVGKVAKELNLNTSRIRYWALEFNIELPQKTVKKTKAKEKFIKVAPITFQAAPKISSGDCNRKVLEICSERGLSFSLFEASSERHIQLLLKLAGGEL